AKSSVVIGAPGIQTSPDETSRLVVQIPTWLWIDGGWWRGYEATASAGRVSATITAAPVSATWDLGEGSSLHCDGPGIAWRPGLREDATDCSFTYTTSSAAQPDGTFDLSVAVTFDVAWTSNVGEGGSLGSITRSSARQVEVGEI